MTFKIYYKDDVIFDIEFYCAKNETAKDANAWYSELSVVVCVREYAYFLKDSLCKDNFNLEEFANDSEKIQELRGWLWETHSNKLCDLDACEKRHYHEFKPELDEILNDYCKKYGFSIVID